MEQLNNRRLVLARRPEGALKDTDFVRDDQTLAELGAGEVRIRVTHLSFAPTQRLWIQADSYLPAVPIGGVVRGSGAGQIVASNHPDYPVGRLVEGLFGWQDYFQGPPATEWGPIRILPPQVTAEQALSVLGLTSATAWFGIHEVLKPEAGETALVSGAAGATGSAAGQILKAKGVRVIGLAGGPDKTRWVTEVAGFGECIDYKNEDVGARLKELAPEGVNMVYENVGGVSLDTALANLAMHARVALCGSVSGYDGGNFAGLRNYMNLVFRRARIQGFLVGDYRDRYDEAMSGLEALLEQGRLKGRVDLQHGFENVPPTFRRLFEGKNQGKQLLKIDDAPLPRSG